MVQTFYTGVGAQVSSRFKDATCLRHPDTDTGLQQQQAQQVLTQFQENPEAWQRVPAILETSNNLNTKVGAGKASAPCEA